MKIINIAIDGPAGAGKSTIAKLAAAKLGFIYVDTGAMYRAMALSCIRNHVSSENEEKVIEICEEADVTIEYKDHEQCVLLDGENVDSYIRTEEVSRMTSSISAYPKVREKLLFLQRGIAKNHNVIMDGRDIGSNVLPNADIKIYLTASVETRARRRYLEQKEKGFDVNLEDIAKDIEERDYRDMHRDCAPLVIAEGAIVIDSSNMTIEEVVDEIIRLKVKAEEG
ncbi:MAG: (d)CMP kinase [Lachnospiraceae bacterium]|nr:(d)CMP kinase [Lachnospiraceae bacterium]